MQVANCHVRLSGDISNEIWKSCVTPAEVLVLRAVHGPDAVVKFEPITGKATPDRRAHDGEFNRLRDTYGEKVVTTVFPGAQPRLPAVFKDIGIDIFEEGKAARKRKAEVVSAGPDAEDGDDGNGDQE